MRCLRLVVCCLLVVVCGLLFVCVLDVFSFFLFVYRLCFFFGGKGGVVVSVFVVRCSLCVGC